MKSSRISTRLGVAFGAMSALVVFVAAIALWQMLAMRAEANTVTERWMPAAMAVQRINSAVIEIRSREIQHVLNMSESVMKAVETGIAANEQTVAAGVAALQSVAESDEEKRLVRSFQTAWSAYWALHGSVLQMSRDNGKDAARFQLDDAGMQARYREARESLATLGALTEAGASAAIQRSSTAFDVARMTMLVAAVLAVALAIASATWFIRRITAPLKSAVEVANQVARNDLTSEIEVLYHDETGQLLDALKTMQEGLSATTLAVRLSAESVASASAEIALGNQDLSRRTEMQAAAVQQAAAAMGQVSELVQHNMNNAAKAEGLAMRASTIAMDGGDFMRQVVTTMKEIDSGSRQVVDIVSVIDGIAFQTNILALNAAVEAARAGELGRGFAVVAGEVRALSKRCAAAARQIKMLIAKSTERVRSGTMLVDSAGSKMQEIVEAVKDVASGVQEISAASRRQNVDVNAVREAISQIDAATQQNSALVEEGAAAAESLMEQARRLAETMRVFKLTDPPKDDLGAAVDGFTATVGPPTASSSEAILRISLGNP